MRDEVLSKISAEMHVQVCAQWRSDVVAQINVDHALLAEIQTKIRSEIRARVYDDVYEELRTKIRDDFVRYL
jgi:energy-converting hydrogenase A subunit M